MNSGGVCDACSPSHNNFISLLWNSGSTNAGTPLLDRAFDGAVRMTSVTLANHGTNVVITPIGTDRAEVISKGIGVGAGGRVGSVSYDDVVVRGPSGWRIAKRTVRLRRADAGRS